MANDWDVYDTAREAYERAPQKKTRGYESRRIAERVKTVTPEPVPLESEIAQASTLPAEFSEDRKAK